MKVRYIAVLALIALILPLGVAQAATSGCRPGTDLFGCIVSGSGPVGMQVENSGANGTALAGWASGSESLYGVWGQADSASGSGVHGLATNGGTGVYGLSNSGPGVYGQTDGGYGVGVSGFASANVDGSEGIGVTGRARATGYGVVGKTDRGVGVFGISFSSIGAPSGFAMEALGNTSQDRTSGGWVKALVRMASGSLSRCYNSQSWPRSDAATCNGFNIAGGAGNYTITFPFRVDDRYLVVTAESVADSPRCCMIQYDFPATNKVRVRTWDHNGVAIDRAFSLVVF